MEVDLLVQARWIVPVEPAGTVLDHHAVAVRDGRIVAVCPAAEAVQFTAQTHLTLDHHLLCPGFINAHGHAAMSLMRGLADDLPLMDWLEHHIWPAEQQFVSREFVRDGTALACAEMLRAGTTCFSDMYFFPDETAEVVDHAHLRAVLGMILIDFPSAWASDPDDYVHKGLALHDHLKGHALLSTAFAPHAPYSVSDDSFSRMAVYAAELDLPVHMHVHETRDEVNQGVAEHGKRPLARLDELGLLNPNLIAVHMTQLEDEEIAAVAEAGASVVHCPRSNMKLASGACPVQRLLDAGVNVALGTDGAASNNTLDMLAEMRAAALLGKLVADDAAAVSAEQALSMATLNGARALGLAEETGSLVVGKWADMQAIDFERPETRPVYHPVSQLVYAADRAQISDVWVAGRHVLRDRALTTLDESMIMERARAWHDKLAQHDQN